MSSRLDAALRKLVEAGVPLEDLNPEVLSRDYGDPRFSRRPMEPESEPYMGPIGGYLDAVMDKVVSGARKVDEHVPRIPGSLSSEQVVRMLEPLRGRDVGATGEHEGDILPMNALMKASLFPVMKFGKPGLKHIAKILGIGGDKPVDAIKQADQLKLFKTGREPKPKSKSKRDWKKQPLTREELIAKNTREEALEKQGELPQSPDHERKRRGMSQKQYDDLIDAGWDYQKIMDEHEILPNAKRREGAGPVRKVPKKPKPLTDEEYDRMFGLREDFSKLDEMRGQMRGYASAKSGFGAKAHPGYDSLIKKLAKKIGWRGPINENTEKAILELASDKYEELLMRSEAWNVDTHIKRMNPEDLENFGIKEGEWTREEHMEEFFKNYGRDRQYPYGWTEEIEWPGGFVGSADDLMYVPPETYQIDDFDIGDLMENDIRALFEPELGYMPQINLDDWYKLKEDPF